MDPNIMNQISQQAGQPPQAPPPPMAPQGQTLPKDQATIIVEALIKQLERLDKQKQMEMGGQPPMM